MTRDEFVRLYGLTETCWYGEFRVEEIVSDLLDAGIVHAQGSHAPKWSVELYCLVRSSLRYWDVRSNDPSLARRRYIGLAINRTRAIAIEAVKKGISDRDYARAAEAIMRLGKDGASGKNAVADFITSGIEFDLESLPADTHPTTYKGTNNEKEAR